MNGCPNNFFKELYETHIDALYRYAFFKMQSNEEEALDIIQETFYKLWIELKKGKKIENYKSYLYRMVSNKIIDYYRKNAPISLDEQIDTHWDIFIDSSDVEDITYAKLEVEKVYRILAWLDDFEKDIFLLRFVEEMSPKEIAERYDANVNSITVRLHRLKDKVKSHFQET
jgi:RNA polymerase sigma factor (sigma-70 family)